MAKYLIFVDGNDRSSWLWTGPEPKAGVNVPAAAKIVEVDEATHLDEIRNLKLVGKAVIVDPPQPAPPSGRGWVDGVFQKSEAMLAAELDEQIIEKLKEVANDKSMTDDEFAAYKRKLERAKYIDNLSDKEAKVAEAEALKRD